MRDYKSEVEQMEIQLAAVSTAAMGGIKDPATKGMYGWSPAYQDTLELRLKYEALLSSLRECSALMTAAVVNDFGPAGRCPNPVVCRAFSQANIKAHTAIAKAEGRA